MFVFEPTTYSKKADKYLASLLVVCKRLVVHIDKGEMVSQRLFRYWWPGKTLNAEVAERTFMDLALTIGVHPYGFGIIPESEGCLHVPVGFNVHLKVCTNIFRYRESNGEDGVETSKVTHAATEYRIPALVVSLSVITKGTHRVRAVVVVEHRNIRYLLTALEKRDDPRFQGIFYILTGGYPDSATREFLSLLGRDTLFEDVPFLFISDHDPDAISLYSTIIQGSRRLAFNSRIGTCPRLEWAGVSLEKYTKLADAWPQRCADDWVRRNPKASPEDTNAALIRGQKQWKALLLFLDRPIAALNASDKQRIKALHQNGNFTDSFHSNVYQELQDMGMNALTSRQALTAKAGRRFALAKLSHFNANGIEECILEILRDRGVDDIEVTEVTPAPEVAGQRAWRGADSGFVVRESDAEEEEDDGIAGSETISRASQSNKLPSIEPDVALRSLIAEMNMQA